MTFRQFLSKMYERWSHQHQFVKTDDIPMTSHGSVYGHKFIYFCKCGAIKVVKVEAD